MMRFNFILLFISALTALNASASHRSVKSKSDNHCPDLSGTFFCEFSAPPGFSKMIGTQSTENGVTTYSTVYSDIDDVPETFRASDAGETDEFGWNTRCIVDSGRKELYSITNDGLMMAETFINAQGNYEQQVNGRTAQVCNRIQ